MKSKRLIVVIISVVLAGALTVGGIAIYASDYYRADVDAIAAFAIRYDVERTVIEGGLAFGDSRSEVGFVFYPGGKVEYNAYEPLMMQLASMGVFCVLLKMPLNLAVLDMNAADGICEMYPDVKKWYIGGHSLGGAMAASYVSSHGDDFEGLILLGAYSTANLSGSELDVLCLHGSEDRVMDREKHDKYMDNLPDGVIEREIEGGCHAFFGAYGAQDGDGNPTVTLEEQITVTTNSIFELILKGE